MLHNSNTGRMRGKKFPLDLAEKGEEEIKKYVPFYRRLFRPQAHHLALNTR